MSRRSRRRLNAQKAEASQRMKKQKRDKENARRIKPKENNMKNSTDEYTSRPIPATFQKGAPHPITYPVRDLADVAPVQTEKLKEVSGLVSPREGRLPLWWLGMNSEEMAKKLPPQGAALDAEMKEAYAVREQVALGHWPQEFFEKHAAAFFPDENTESWNFDMHSIPELLRRVGITDGESAAEAVRMDHALALARAIEKYFYSIGMKPNGWTGHVDFLEKNQRQARHFDRINMAHEITFHLKYTFGGIRPEEWTGVAGCLVTQYSEGCPGHPGPEAGHGAASGATLKSVEHEWSDAIAKNPTAGKMAKSACMLFSQFRTLALMHTVSDNTGGFATGVEVTKMMINGRAIMQTKDGFLMTREETDEWLEASGWKKAVA